MIDSISSVFFSTPVKREWDVGLTVKVSPQLELFEAFYLNYRELESKRKSNSRGSNTPHDLSSEDTDSSESYHHRIWFCAESSTSYYKLKMNGVRFVLFNLLLYTKVWRSRFHDNLKLPINIC